MEQGFFKGPGLLSMSPESNINFTVAKHAGCARAFKLLICEFYSTWSVKEYQIAQDMLLYGSNDNVSIL